MDVRRRPVERPVRSEAFFDGTGRKKTANIHCLCGFWAAGRTRRGCGAGSVRWAVLTKVIAKNKKALHDYTVVERLEAGIALYGTEVKSIRAGRVNLKESFCVVEEGQLVVVGMHISPYEQGNLFNRDPLRKRVLLMHRREIMRLYGLVKQEGMALIPLSLYFKGQHVKVELGLCKGKRQHDKRAAAAERDAKREIDRAMRSRTGD
ncbi:MAG: SsrA-binding protein SmpB [Clostridiales bacterium]|nr:SsrA-binding protein SmpB [Clostridiales bacterium]